MSLRAIITLGLALMFGVSASFLIRQALAPKLAQNNQLQAQTEVVVATKKIPHNTTLSKDMLTTKSLSTDSIPQGVVPAAELDSLIGQVSRNDLEVGEQLFKSKVSKRLTVATEIKPGMLAFTISTPNASSSNAGLLQPEDRVNVLYSPSGQEGTSTVTVLHGMRIIAINREYLQRSPDSKQAFEQVLSVTLEVSKDQSELLSWTASRGTLSLALLSQEQSGELAAPVDLSINDLQKTTEVAQLVPSDAPKEQINTDPANPNAQEVSILVPTRSVSVGEVIAADALAATSRPMAEVPEGALLADRMAEIVGTQPLVALVRGEPLFLNRFSKRRGSLSEFVSPGKRAFRLKSDAGRIIAEDRVDVVFTPDNSQTSQNQTRGAGMDSLTLARALRVIVVNDQPETTNTAGDAYASAQTVVLDVTPAEAQMLSWAKQHGTLDLMVVPEAEQEELTEMVTLDELKQAVLGSPEEEKAAVATAAPVAAGLNSVILINELRNRALGQTEIRLYP